MDEEKKEVHLYVGKRTLAPLVGGSDISYRRLCRRYGAQLTFTQMCIADVYLNSIKGIRKSKKERYFEFHPDDRPLILQLAGNTPEPIIEMANLDLFKGHIDGVDINCGCPQGFAMKGKIGAAMLHDPDLLVSLCREVVSVKLRFCESVENTISIISRLRETGVTAVTIHGRYWWQKGQKRGKCDWEGIQRIKKAFPDFPIVLNGDASSYTDFEELREKYGVDAVMTGYGALRDPSIFNDSKIPLEQILTDYLSLALENRNQLIDILRHVGWLTKGHLSGSERVALFTLKTMDALVYDLTFASRL